MKNKLIVLSLVLILLLTSCGSNVTAPSDNGGNMDKGDLGSALNLVMGSSTSNPSVFPSYHIEVTLDTPALGTDGKSIINETTQISADVEGANVHIFQLDPGATDKKEGYIIGNDDYKIVDGTPQAENGQVSLGWSMWSLQVVMVYAYPVYYAEKTGTDTIDGRPALIYEFDTEKIDAQAANDTMKAMGLGDSTSGKGTVWIDQATGAMLKLDETYNKKILDSNNSQVGIGSGSVKIEVSKVGQVTVTSPIK